MRRVMIASPLRGDETTNIRYAQSCAKDCFARGEAPWAPHLLYPQFMRDDIEAERNVSIAAGIEWAEQAEVLAVYTDRGISSGMRTEIAAATKYGVLVEYRTLPNWVAPPVRCPVWDRFQALAEAAYGLGASQGWRRDWEGAGCNLHLEASEFIEALRGKGGSSPVEEAGDVLFVLLSTLVAHNIPVADVLASLEVKIRDYVPKEV